MFGDGLKDEKAEDVRVRDVAKIVAEELRHRPVSLIRYRRGTNSRILGVGRRFAQSIPTPRLFPSGLTHRPLLQAIHYLGSVTFVAVMDASRIICCVETVDPPGDVAAAVDAPGKVLVAGVLETSPLFLQCCSHRRSSSIS
jgi:hypothetical protein